MGGHDDSVADGDVSDDARLAGEDDVVADASASGDAGLGNDEAMFADVDVVSDLDEVIDFGAFADDGSSEARAINGGVRADFDVIFDDDDSELGDFCMFTVDFFEAEAIAADDGSGVEDNAIADFATREDGGAWVEVAVSSYVSFVADVAMGFESGVGANACMGLDDAEWAYTG